MKAEEVIDGLRKRGADLILEGDILRYRGPAELMTQQLRATLTRHRSELVDLLRTVKVPQHPEKESESSQETAALLTPYQDLIAAASEGKLPCETVTLHPWAVSIDPAKTVLSSARDVTNIASGLLSARVWKSLIASRLNNLWLLDQWWQERKRQL